LKARIDAIEGSLTGDREGRLERGRREVVSEESRNKRARRTA
jgi:hypothetical protein